MAAVGVQQGPSLVVPLPGGDARRFAAAKRLDDLLGCIVGVHFPVQEVRHVRPAVEIVAANDQSGDRVLAQRDLRHGSGVGGLGVPSSPSTWVTVIAAETAAAALRKSRRSGREAGQSC